jgi:transcription initiation factor TFIIIB Brf1 subunit/transcription initiation factor TFIIB
MFVAHNSRKFGRDISNVNHQTNAVAQKPVVKKAVLPPRRAVQTTSVASVAHVPQQAHYAAPLAKEPVNSNSMQSFAMAEKMNFHETRVKESQKLIFASDEDLSDEDDPMAIEMNNVSLEDIDQFDMCDPQFVSEYIMDIMSYLKEKELEVRIPADYCSKQKDILPSHRDQIMRYIADLYVQLKLLTETFFLAVNIVDQVMATGPLAKKKLQIVALTAVLIASKYEETYATSIRDLRTISSGVFTEQDILRMERLVLNRINFNLCTPAPIHFLRRYSKAGHSDGVTHTIAKYIAEVSCLSYDLLAFLPSEIAAACVYLSRKIKQISPDWNSNLTYYSGYQLEHLCPCINVLVRVLKTESSRRGTGRSSAITQKYSEKRFLYVAQTVAQAFGN